MILSNEKGCAVCKAILIRVDVRPRGFIPLLNEFFAERVPDRTAAPGQAGRDLFFRVLSFKKIGRYP
ncbi:hypothetical protein VN23_04565 [Janthinobacterium sp. B9-8]|nr:hypothetical protein VN23_04565 [Janthinobacterium sp. B9-8]